MQNLQDLNIFLFFAPPFFLGLYWVCKLLTEPYPKHKSFLLILSASIICFVLTDCMEMVMTDIDPLIKQLPLEGLQLHSITALAALPGWAFLYLLKRLHRVHCPERVLLYCGGLVWVIVPLLLIVHLIIDGESL